MEEANKNVCAHCGSGCKCPHHKMIPLFIVVLGVVFLLKAFGVVSAEATNIVWPILVILGGLQKMFGGMCKCCSRDMGGQKCCGTAKEQK